MARDDERHTERNSSGSGRDRYRDNDDARDPLGPDERVGTKSDSKSEARGDARENVGNTAHVGVVGVRRARRGSVEWRTVLGAVGGRRGGIGPRVVGRRRRARLHERLPAVEVARADDVSAGARAMLLLWGCHASLR